jgi:hypothetical protein
MSSVLRGPSQPEAGLHHHPDVPVARARRARGGQSSSSSPTPLSAGVQIAARLFATLDPAAVDPDVAVRLLDTVTDALDAAGPASLLADFSDVPPTSSTSSSSSSSSCPPSSVPFDLAKVTAATRAGRGKFLTASVPTKGNEPSNAACATSPPPLWMPWHDSKAREQVWTAFFEGPPAAASTSPLPHSQSPAAAASPLAPSPAPAPAPAPALFSFASPAQPAFPSSSSSPPFSTTTTTTTTTPSSAAPFAVNPFGSFLLPPPSQTLSTAPGTPPVLHPIFGVTTPADAAAPPASASPFPSIAPASSASPSSIPTRELARAHILLRSAGGRPPPVDAVDLYAATSPTTFVLVGTAAAGDVRFVRRMPAAVVPGSTFPLSFPSAAASDPPVAVHEEYEVVVDADTPVQCIGIRLVFLLSTAAQALRPAAGATGFGGFMPSVGAHQLAVARVEAFCYANEGSTATTPSPPPSSSPRATLLGLLRFITAALDVVDHTAAQPPQQPGGAAVHDAAIRALVALSLATAAFPVLAALLPALLTRPQRLLAPDAAEAGRRLLLALRSQTEGARRLRRSAEESLPIRPRAGAPVSPPPSVLSLVDPSAAPSGAGASSPSPSLPSSSSPSSPFISSAMRFSRADTSSGVEISDDGKTVRSISSTPETLYAVLEASFVAAPERGRGQPMWWNMSLDEDTSSQCTCFGFAVKPLGRGSYDTNPSIYVVRAFNGQRYARGRAPTSEGGPYTESSISRGATVRFDIDFDEGDSGVCRLLVNGVSRGVAFTGFRGHRIHPVVAFYSNSRAVSILGMGGADDGTGLGTDPAAGKAGGSASSPYSLGPPGSALALLGPLGFASPAAAAAARAGGLVGLPGPGLGTLALPSGRGIGNLQAGTSVGSRPGSVSLTAFRLSVGGVEAGGGGEQQLAGAGPQIAAIVDIGGGTAALRLPEKQKPAETGGAKKDGGGTSKGAGSPPLRLGGRAYSRFLLMAPRTVRGAEALDEGDDDEGEDDDDEGDDVVVNASRRGVPEGKEVEDESARPLAESKTEEPAAVTRSHSASSAGSAAAAAAASAAGAAALKRVQAAARRSGLLRHASVALVPLDGRFERFTGGVGIGDEPMPAAGKKDDAPSSARVVYEVVGDGAFSKPLWRSSPLHVPGAAPEPFSVPVVGVSVLALVVRFETLPPLPPPQQQQAPSLTPQGDRAAPATSTDGGPSSPTTSLAAHPAVLRGGWVEPFLLAPSEWECPDCLDSVRNAADAQHCALCRAPRPSPADPVAPVPTDADLGLERSGSSAGGTEGGREGDEEMLAPSWLSTTHGLAHGVSVHLGLLAEEGARGGAGLGSGLRTPVLPGRGWTAGIDLFRPFVAEYSAESAVAYSRGVKELVGLLGRTEKDFAHNDDDIVIRSALAGLHACWGLTARLAAVACVVGPALPSDSQLGREWPRVAAALRDVAEAEGAAAARAADGGAVAPTAHARAWAAAETGMYELHFGLGASFPAGVQFGAPHASSRALPPPPVTPSALDGPGVVVFSLEWPFEDADASPDAGGAILQLESLLMSVQLHARAHGWRTEVLGRWPVRLHVVVDVPLFPGAAAFLDADISTMCAAMDMRGWSFPHGLANGVVRLPIRIGGGVAGAPGEGRGGRAGRGSGTGIVLDRPGVGEVCVYPSRPGQVGGGGSSDGGGAPRTAVVTGAGFDDVVGALRLALTAQEQVG